MGDINKTISISYEAKVQNLLNGIQKVGNVSEKESRKIARELERAYKEATRESEKAKKKQVQDLKRIQREAKKTAKSYKGMTQGIAAGFAVAGVALFSFTQHIADLSNQMVDASAKTGVSVETLSALRLAAEGSGLQFEALEAGLVKLPALMDKVNQGNKSAVRLFDRLGVSVTETRDGFETLRSADDVLKDIFESLKEVESAEEKAALAAKVFGQQAGPKFLQSGALDNLESFVELSKEFGLDQGPAMQQQMATFQRAASTAMMVAKNEMFKLIEAWAGKGGMTNAILLATKGFVVFGEVGGLLLRTMNNELKRNIKLGKALFHALKGDFETADFYWKRSGKTAMETFNDWSSILGTISTKTSKLDKMFRSSLGGGGGGGGCGRGGKTPEQQAAEEEKKAAKEAAKIQGNTNRAKQFALSLTEQNIQAYRDLEESQLNLLSSLDKETEKRDIALRKIDETERKYNKAITDFLKENEGAAMIGMGESLDKIFAEKEDRERLFQAERQAIIEESEKNIQSLRKEMDAEKIKLDDAEKERIRQIGETRKQEILDATSTFDSVSSHFVQMGDLTSQLIERFGEKNKKNQELAFNISKGAAISEAVINTALAVTRAYATMDPILASIATAGIVGVGAAQIALIASEQPKFHMGGLVGNTLAPDERQIVAKSGEGVLSTQAVKALGGEQGLQRLERGQSPKPMVVVTNPFKHYDRFIKGRKLMGLDLASTGRAGY